MKKLMKVLGIVLGIVILVALCGIGYVKWGLPNVGPAPDLKVELTPQRVAHGKYLANNLMGCMDCHARRDFSKFPGPVVAGTEGAGGEKWGHSSNFPGEVYSPNITPYGLKDWTDGEIYRAITTGVNKDGKALFPLMPYENFGKLPDEDIYDVIAYLRTLKPIKNEIPPRKLDFPLNLIVNTIPHKQEEKILKPDTTNHLLYGEYLVTAASCQDCHTPMVKGEYDMNRKFAGGMEFILPNGTIVTSANLTPHTEYGLGRWDSNRFLSKFHEFSDSNFEPRPVAQGEFNTYMPWTVYCNLSDSELKSIFTYLQSLKPIGNKVEKFKVAEIQP